MKLENKVKAVKAVKSYGHLTLRSSDIPAAKDLTLGDKQTLIIEVDVQALRKPDNWDISENGMKPGDVIAEVRILKVESPKVEKK